MLIQKLQNIATKTPGKQAIVYKGKAISYAELLEEIEKRAERILPNISEKNILLNHTNELENLINFLAIISINKIGIFASKHLKNNEIENIKAKYSAFILDEKAINNIDQNIHHSSFTDQHSSFNISHSSLFLGVLSSGTTATPKLIFKDYQAWLSAFPHQSEVFGIGESDRLFVLDAMAYSANLNTVLHMLWLGGTVVMTSLNSANSWVEQIEKEKVTSIFMVPSHYRLLVKNRYTTEVGMHTNNTKDNYLKNLKSIISAGEKLDVETTQKLLKFAPNALLTEYYGSAELGHISYHQGQEIIDNPLSVGRPFPEVKIKIENEQIFVDSPYISPDFRKIKTNFDLGYFVDNQLILMGRAGRMFNKRGLNVFAEEIENLAKKLPFIIEAAAIGLLQENGSHEIFLIYTCKNGFHNSVNNNLIIKYLSNNLQAAKRPDRIQEFENLPRTDFGKIDFKALARNLEEEIFA